jgi:hypothetical protein
MEPKDLERFLMEGKSPSGSNLMSKDAQKSADSSVPTVHEGHRIQQNVGLLSTLLGAVLSLLWLGRWWKQRQALKAQRLKEEMLQDLQRPSNQHGQESKEHGHTMSRKQDGPS